MENEESSLQNENNNAYPPKKKIDTKNQNDLEFIQISTNLSQIELNVKAINGVYLFGCDIEEEIQISQDFNPVHTMRKARKCKCFQEELKNYVSNYYISGLILMGKPINDAKKFKFYLKIRELDKTIIDSEILESKPKNIEEDEKVYKFKFKRKKKDLSEMKQEDNESGDAQCVANYLNICLGKILKRCGYTKDRTSRKILYYNKNDAENAIRLERSDYLCFPALKAVCETYEGGKIYMKILPKKLLHTFYTYEDYFNSLKEKNPHSNFDEIFQQFTTDVVKKRGIKIYDQSLIKIEEIVYENPYDIWFKDRNDKKWNVGDYYSQHWNINLDNERTLFAVRKVDKGGKLQGADILKIHIPCKFLQIVGNIFGDTINIKSMVQSPSEKFDEIYYIRDLLKKNAIKSEEDKLNSYLGDKFDPVTVDGQVIMPPLIQFGEDENHKNQMVEVTNGSFDLMGTSPYSKVKELKKIDIYFLDIDLQQGRIIWEKLKEAGKNLGIKFQKDPAFYEIEVRSLGRLIELDCGLCLVIFVVIIGSSL